jgi:Mlc titration factor MtfA (ptsG expression regulator)
VSYEAKVLDGVVGAVRFAGIRSSSRMGCVGWSGLHVHSISCARLRVVLHRRRGLPEDWLEIVDEHVAVWRLLDDDEREVVEGVSDWLLRHKHFEAANGFELVDEITVTIAVQAAVLVLGLSVDDYREVSAVIVYPTTMRSSGVHAGPASGTVTDEPVAVLGEAHDRRGPVLLAWDQVEEAARTPGTGHNVVFHEFAHKLDMADGIIDGTPRLDRREDRERWIEVCTEAYDALRSGVDRSPLQPYGATNPAEFFAVATEAFFDVPVMLERHEPDLYMVLRGFYRQDPAERARRPIRST